ncbi:MAG: hypothetical protein AAGI69_10535 [Cyanobacteria bacterium P01_H01_bin.21]
MGRQQRLTTQPWLQEIVISSIAAASIFLPSTAIAAPVPYISDEVGFNNATSRAQVDTLDTPWQSAATTIGATIITQNQIPAGSNTTISGNAHTLFTTASGITVTTSLHDVTDVDLSIPNSIGFVATGNAQLSTNDTLQGNAPRPASFYNTTAHSRYWNENSGSTTSRNAILFDFSEPVTAFGAWFGDLETSPNGTSAIVRLLDASGNRIGDDIVVPPTIDPSQCGAASFRGCGNRTTRWIGFVDDASQVKQMLVVVGDDAAGETGNREHLSFIGATLAEKPQEAMKSVILVKRITAINGDRTQNPNDNTPLNISVNDGVPNSADDKNNWPESYLLGELNAGLVQPGDEIEYTIYFLNANSGEAASVRICDWIQPNQTFVNGVYGGNDIELNMGGSIYNLTAVSDATDRAAVVTVGNLPTTPSCNLPAGANNNDNVLVLDITGTTGVPAGLTTLPGSIGQGTPNNAYGFFRFTTQVNE